LCNNTGLRRVQISVNGEQLDLPAGTTVARLIETLDMRPKLVAVERNRELIPRAEHKDCVLHENDEVEVVTLVGGG